MTVLGNLIDWLTFASPAVLLEGLKAYLECSQDGTPHITGEAELARAQLMGQIDREVLKATGLGMRGVAETGRRGPGCSRTDIRRSPTHCVVAFKSGSMVSHPLPVVIKWVPTV